MAITPLCDKCGKELTQFGALLFSPPNDQNETKKSHLCRECYKTIVEEFMKK